LYVQRMAREKAEGQKKNYGLRLDQGLMRELSHLAVDEDRWLNELAEEAIRDLLKKYEKKK
jgi:predicted transcriptional regulator